MKKGIVAAVVAAALTAMMFGSVVYAANDASHDPGIVARFERQQMRIDQAVKTGNLTKEEAAMVQNNLDRIKAEEAKLKAAGQLTPKAKADLNKKLDMNSKMIEAQRKNAIKRID